MNNEPVLCTLMPQKCTVHLHWSGTLDMDIFGLCTDVHGATSLVSFADLEFNESSAVQILSDFAFQQVPADNQEIIQVLLDDGTIKCVDFFAWEFESVQNGQPCGFEHHDVFVEVVQSKSWSTSKYASGPDEGNALYLGRLIFNEQWHFVSRLHAFTAPLYEDLQEVQNFFKSQVTIYTSV